MSPPSGADYPPNVAASGSSSGRVLAAARTLRVDATTAAVLRAFGAAGLRSIVLKGPTLQRELYDDGSWRRYCDTDLLIAPVDLERAGGTLGELGFELAIDHREHPGVCEPHAQEWSRAAGEERVDLHWRLAGAGAPAERAWRVLAARTHPIEVGAAAGEALTRPGVALVVALHAAQHGRTHRKPQRDLERALERFGPSTWAAAGDLAEELHAREAFAAGLRLSPAGAGMARELGLPAVRSPQLRLMAGDQPPGSFGMLRVLEAAGGRARLRAVRSELFPAPAFMRASSPLARHGRMGLGLAYPARIAARAWRLPAAIRVVRESRAP